MEHALTVMGCIRPVFPTPVGVFPEIQNDLRKHHSLPHARGGVSYDGTLVIYGEAVFPTPVGVLPWPEYLAFQSSSLPHARGGVSISTPGLRTLL